jgi:hypothetical protein
MELVLFQDKPYRTNTNLIYNKLFFQTLQIPIPLTVCTSQESIKQDILNDRKFPFTRVLVQENWKKSVNVIYEDQALLQKLSQEHEELSKKLEAFLSASVQSSEKYLCFILHLKGLSFVKQDSFSSFFLWLRNQSKTFILRDALLETPHILLIPTEKAHTYLQEILALQQQRASDHLSVLESGPLVFANLQKETKFFNGDYLLQQWSKGKADVEYIDMDVAVEGPTVMLQQFMDAQSTTLFKSASFETLSSISPSSFLASQQMDSTSSSTVAWIFLAVIAIIFVVAFGITFSRAFPSKLKYDY